MAYTATYSVQYTVQALQAAARVVQSRREKAFTADYRPANVDV